MRARPEFSFDRPFTASVLGGFVWDGRRYEHGEVVPWQQLGIAKEEIWELWTQFQVESAAEVMTPVATPTPAPVARPMPTPPPPPQQQQQRQHHQQHGRHHQHRR